MSDYCSVGVSAGLSLELVLCIAASDVRDQRDITALKRHADIGFARSRERVLTNRAISNKRLQHQCHLVLMMYHLVSEPPGTHLVNDRVDMARSHLLSGASLRRRRNRRGNIAKLLGCNPVEKVRWQ